MHELYINMPFGNWNDHLDCDDKSLKVEAENTGGVALRRNFLTKNFELLATRLWSISFPNSI